MRRADEPIQDLPVASAHRAQEDLMGSAQTIERSVTPRREPNRNLRTEEKRMVCEHKMEGQDNVGQE